MHFYGDEHHLFLIADSTAKRLRLAQPWIVGEAFYNDPIAAQNLRGAISDTGRSVKYLTQWPLTRGSACADVDVSAPTAFDAYVGAGFGARPGGNAGG
jgi:hypothetical protein